jgi:type II secretory ATPase GspE/PulE/Tfp pilus assembly ATPase PilB-like protein
MWGVLAQRLCKRIGLQCKEAYHPSQQEYDELVQEYGAQDWPTLGIEYGAEWSLYRGRGCEACNRTCFKGRVPLRELLLPSEDLKQLIQTRPRTTEMLTLAVKEGMGTLIQDGI